MRGRPVLAAGTRRGPPRSCGGRSSGGAWVAPAPMIRLTTRWIRDPPPVPFDRGETRVRPTRWCCRRVGPPPSRRGRAARARDRRRDSRRPPGRPHPRPACRRCRSCRRRARADRRARARSGRRAQPTRSAGCPAAWPGARAAMSPSDRRGRRCRSTPNQRTRRGRRHRGDGDGHTRDDEHQRTERQDPERDDAVATGRSGAVVCVCVGIGIAGAPRRGVTGSSVKRSMTSSASSSSGGRFATPSLWTPTQRVGTGDQWKPHHVIGAWCTVGVHNSTI